MTTRKFDVVIGNPPYQEDGTGDTNRAEPVYNRFMDAAYAIADRVVLITPARFLSGAGQTPKAWNNKMLADEHLTVAHYQSNSDALFPGTDIKGGIVVTYRDATKVLGPIGTFAPHDEMSGVMKKTASEPSLSTIVSSRALYRFSDKAMTEYGIGSVLSAGTGSQVSPISFKILRDKVFFASKPSDGHEYIQIVGVLGSGRTGRRERQWIRRDYVVHTASLDSWKVLVAKANNSGAFGETLASPFVGEPGLGHTDTFLTVGGFATEVEANAALTYLKTKFARAMLSILKTTHNNAKGTWKLVPMPDFTTGIDWSLPIPDIDQALYKKYGLSQAEIQFIEGNVKPMK